MNLKCEIKRDCQGLFMYEDDFAERHLVDGKAIPCIIDNEELKQRQGSNELGIEECSLLIFTPVYWLPDKKAIGDAITFDGKTYVVASWNVDLGMNEIALTHKG